MGYDMMSGVIRFPPEHFIRLDGKPLIINEIRQGRSRGNGITPARNPAKRTVLVRVTKLSKETGIMSIKTSMAVLVAGCVITSAPAHAQCGGKAQCGEGVPQTRPSK